MQPVGRAEQGPIVFLVEVFDADTAPLGLDTPARQAVFLDMNPGSFSRARRGLDIGGAFMARVSHAPWPDGPRPLDRYFRAVPLARLEPVAAAA